MTVSVDTAMRKAYLRAIWKALDRAQEKADRAVARVLEDFSS